jgi:hypothetical protein
VAGTSGTATWSVTVRTHSSSVTSGNVRVQSVSVYAARRMRENSRSRLVVVRCQRHSSWVAAGTWTSTPSRTTVT